MLTITPPEVRRDYSGASEEKKKEGESNKGGAQVSKKLFCGGRKKSGERSKV